VRVRIPSAPPALTSGNIRLSCRRAGPWVRERVPRFHSVQWLECAYEAWRQPHDPSLVSLDHSGTCSRNVRTRSGRHDTASGGSVTSAAPGVRLPADPPVSPLLRSSRPVVVITTGSRRSPSSTRAPGPHPSPASPHLLTDNIDSTLAVPRQPASQNGLNRSRQSATRPGTVKRAV
jgi:hypothetical protein